MLNGNLPGLDAWTCPKLLTSVAKIKDHKVAASPQIRNISWRVRSDAESFLDELIVRRELGINFVHYSPNYDAFGCLPRWALQTLEAHRKDTPEHVYPTAQLEAADTHDPYWNAACREMLITGYMHNHMRMYWGKKILEWSRTPEDAYAATLALMNRYYLDARDPNSYSNVAWLFGQHAAVGGTADFRQSSVHVVVGPSAKPTSRPMSRKLKPSPGRRDNDRADQVKQEH